MTWRLLAVLGAASVVRFVLAAAVPLVPDETYYWEWSRRLAAGYFDHPPAIAALIRAGTLVAGDSPLGVRLFSVVAGSATIAATALLARRLGGDDAAFWTAIIGSVLPLSALGLTLATPDSPFLCAAALTLLAVDRAASAPPGIRAAALAWLLAGLALGAAMLSKITAALLPLGVFVGLLAAPALRRHLATPGPYLAVAVAAGCFAPTILWNRRHDWVSFAFQARHGLGGSGGSVGARVAREAALVGGQAGLASPVLFVLCIAACASSLPLLRRRRLVDARAGLLAAVAICLAAVFVYSALSRNVEPNWPAPAYLPAITLLSVRAANEKRWRQWTIVGVGVATALTVAASAHAIRPYLPIRPAKDPTARGAGWEEVAVAAEWGRQREVSRLANASARVWIAANRYQDASELAFHLPGRSRTFALNLGSRPNQYSLWPSFTDEARPGDGLIVVSPSVGPSPPAEVDRLRPHFTEAMLVVTASLRRNERVVGSRAIWVLRQWRGSWPSPSDGAP